jgi:hypothetical protein
MTPSRSLLREAREFSLRHACEDCVYFAPKDASCVHGYPNEMHRRAAAEARGSIEFCKEFELL